MRSAPSASSPIGAACRTKRNGAAAPWPRIWPGRAARWSGSNGLRPPRPGLIRSRKRRHHLGGEQAQRVARRGEIEVGEIDLQRGVLERPNALDRARHDAADLGRRADPGATRSDLCLHGKRLHALDRLVIVAVVLRSRAGNSVAGGLASRAAIRAEWYAGGL